MNETQPPRLKKAIVKLIGKMTGAHCYCYSEGRVKLGAYRLETGIKKRGREWAFGGYFEIGGYEGDEKQIHFALGPLYVYLSKEYGTHFDDPKKYGVDLTASILRFWYGAYDWTGEDDKNKERRFRYKDAFLDCVFGRTMFFKHDVDYRPTKVPIPMPEGVYTAEFTRQRLCWMRPRWPFRKVRESIDINIPKGIPFAGKGENSWDCGDDGLYGTGSETWSQDAAIKRVQDYVAERRAKYGHASSEAISEALSK
jgi:hypothetical protein